MSERDTTLTAINAVKAIRCLPDGSKIPSGLKHALLVLASYYPNIFPGQHRLADDMGLDRSNVNRRLRKLEDAGLITRIRRGHSSTLYGLRLGVIRKCSRVALAPQEYQPIGTDSDGADIGDPIW